jgi:hypothetical protein
MRSIHLPLAALTELLQDAIGKDLTDHRGSLVDLDLRGL